MTNLYLIIYINRKNEIIYRNVKFLPMYEVHTFTSFGWYVLDIQILYKGKYIPLKEYEDILKKEIEIYHKKYDKKNISLIKNIRLKKSIIRKIFKKYI